MGKSLGPLMAILGMAAVPYILYTQRALRKKDRDAWDAYARTLKVQHGTEPGHAVRETWDAAVKYARRDDGATFTRKTELEDILGHASEIVRVSEGLRKAQVLLYDESVPDLVRASILAHWFGQWNTNFGIWPQGPFDEREIYLKIRSELKHLRAEHGRNGSTAGFGVRQDLEGEAA